MRSTSSCEEALEVEEHHHHEDEEDESQPISPTNKGVFSSITSAVQNTVSARPHLSISQRSVFFILDLSYSVPFNLLVLLVSL